MTQPYGQLTPTPQITTAHTQEPWMPSPGRPNEMHKVHTADGRHIATFGRREDMERAAACVNACAGVPIEELEKLAALKCDIPGIADVAQMAMLGAVTTDEYDRLVAALRKICNAKDGIAQMIAIAEACPLADEATP